MRRTAQSPLNACVPAATPPQFPDPLTSEVVLRRQRVVRAAAQLEVVDGRWSSAGVGLSMMKLDAGALAAALASRVGVSATALVTLPHRAAHLRRHRSSPRRRGAMLGRSVSRGSRTLGGASLSHAQALH